MHSPCIQHPFQLITPFPASITLPIFSPHPSLHPTSFSFFSSHSFQYQHPPHHIHPCIHPIVIHLTTHSPSIHHLFPPHLTQHPRTPSR
ncbi:hypothetical protein E2C01_082356 [Portunus trituberculatus]|uniref:Uncharacterized protein n=1 Tax=Portunus trituberculatus TaxID=210409 RepID=A0A5B7J4Q5_PORTR|nr:hypothetical protein [Portunus trituberculatus]